MKRLFMLMMGLILLMGSIRAANDVANIQWKGCYNGVMQFEMVCSRRLNYPEQCAVLIPYGSTAQVSAVKIDGQSVAIDASWVEISPVHHLRGMDCVVLKIMGKPGYVKSESTVSIELTTVGGEGRYSVPEFRSHTFDVLYAEVLVNSELLESIDYFVEPKDEESAEFLVICPDDPAFIAAGERLCAMRKRLGLVSRVATITETGSTPGEIKAFVLNAFMNWTPKPEAILFAGNDELIPMFYFNESFYTDIPYVDLEDSGAPILGVSRIPVATAAEFSSYIDRLLGYEKNPPMEAGYYQHPLTSMAWEDNSSGMISAEIVNGWFSQVKEAQPNRVNAIASGAPGNDWQNEDLLQAYGPQGTGYVPATPEYLTNWEGTHTNINQYLNEGTMMWYLRNPASAQGLTAPAYAVQHLDGLTLAAPFFMMAVTDNLGDITQENSFTEALMSSEHGPHGMIAMNGAGLSETTDYYAFDMMDGLWNDFIPTGMNLLHPKYRMGYTAILWAQMEMDMFSPFSAEQKKTTNYLFNYYGDSFGRLYDSIPQTFIIEHPDTLMSTQSSIEIIAPAGAYLTLLLNGEIVDRSPSNGDPLVLEVTGHQANDTLAVCGLLNNHVDYYHEIIVDKHVGLSESVIKALCMYPNPCSDKITLEFNEPLSNARASIYNLSGQCIAEIPVDIFSSNVICDVHQLHTGVYLLQIACDNMIFSQRIQVVR